MAKWSRWVQIWQIYPPVDLLADVPPWHCPLGHLVVKMSSNLADLPLDLLADLSPDWHLVAKFGRSTLDLPADVPPSTHSGKEWQFQVSNSSYGKRQIYPQYWHLVVKIWPFSFLELPGRSPLVSFQGSCGQDEFKFGRSTPRSAGRSPPRTDILWSRWVQIWQIYP